MLAHNDVRRGCDCDFIALRDSRLPPPIGLPTCKLFKHMRQTWKQPLLKQCARESGNDGAACKLTWLVLGGDPAARSHRVEQFTAL